jgi:hypothetical protein
MSNPGAAISCDRLSPVEPSVHRLFLSFNLKPVYRYVKLLAEFHRQLLGNCHRDNNSMVPSSNAQIAMEQGTTKLTSLL